jgi:hypothetical protein
MLKDLQHRCFLLVCESSRPLRVLFRMLSSFLCSIAKMSEPIQKPLMHIYDQGDGSSTFIKISYTFHQLMHIFMSLLVN